MTTSAVTFPGSLDSAIRADVKRPMKSRSTEEKEAAEEVLVVEVEPESDVYVKFDVYLNDEDGFFDKKSQVKTEYAGSFVNVPRKPKVDEHGSKTKSSLRLGLTQLIQDLGADDDEGVMVTLVPRYGVGRKSL